MLNIYFAGRRATRRGNRRWKSVPPRLSSPAGLLFFLCVVASIFLVIQVANQQRLVVTGRQQRQPWQSSYLWIPNRESSESPKQDQQVIRHHEKGNPAPGFLSVTPAIDGGPPPYNVVFSTSCNDQQHWESMVFFYHAWKVKQPGNVTRILSGCHAKEEQLQAEFFQNYIQPMSNNFHLHFTPDFSKGFSSNYRGSYKYMNKPRALLHWMEHGTLNMPSTKSTDDDGIVILMDPDMILLRPIVHNFSDIDSYLWTEESPKTRVVRHGFPMAQLDGFLSNSWMNLNITHIIAGGGGDDDDDDDSSDEHTGHLIATMPPPKEGPVHWNTGPPYLATARDMYQIALKWSEYTPRVLDEYPKLFAEMFGFIFATVQLQLPFTMVLSLVVSKTTTRNREGWYFVDALPKDQVCTVPSTGTRLPVILHYCERYEYGQVSFSKKDYLDQNLLACNQPLLRPPPPNFVGKYDYSVPLGISNNNNESLFHSHNRQPLQIDPIGKREAFMLCNLIRLINEALLYHKQRACPSGFFQAMSQTFW